MIPRLKRLLSTLCILTLFASCGGGGDDDNSLAVETSVTTWQFDSFEYDGGVSAGDITTDSEGNDFGVLVVSTEEDDSNGDYSGSALTFAFNAVGGGIYNVVSSSEFAEARNEDPMVKVMTLSCTVGTARVDATRYDALSGGNASVSIDNLGRYHIDVAGIQVNQTVNVGDGVPDAPPSASLQIDNAFNF